MFMGTLQLVSMLNKGWRYISTGLIVYFWGMGVTSLEKNGNRRERLRVVKHDDDADFGGGFLFTRLEEPGKLPAEAECEANGPYFLFGAVAYKAEQVGALRRKSK